MQRAVRETMSVSEQSVCQGMGTRFARFSGCPCLHDEFSHTVIPKKLVLPPGFRDTIRHEEHPLTGRQTKLAGDVCLPLADPKHQSCGRQHGAETLLP